MRKKALTSSGVLATAMLVSQVAAAAGTVYSTVVAVRVDATGRGMVVFNDNIGGTPPACRHSSYFNALAFDANTAGGKAILALALSAKATGSPVQANGNGTCIAYGGAFVEDWDYGEQR